MSRLEELMNSPITLDIESTIDDVVKAVLFLVKDAPFMTGSIIRLDGGYVLGGDKVAPMPVGVV